ncbi:unnamed protein product [Penicillium bialowiezense]
MVEIVRGFHRGANNNHTHEDQSNEDRFNKYQALSKDDSDDKSPTNAQSLSEDKSHEERLNKHQALYKDPSYDEPRSESEWLSEDESIGERFNNAHPVSILDLPPEMMNEVGSHLSVVSQACLLLTCKKLYVLFNYVLNNPAFGFPYSDGLDELDVSIRTDFLSKLESERWKYCAACLKLHPLEDFDPTSRGYENPIRRFCKWPDPRESLA